MAGQNVHFEGIGQWVRRDAVQGVGEGTLGMPEIMGQLKVEPKVGGDAAESGQPGCHLRRDGSRAGQHAVERLARDRQFLGGLGHRQTKLGQHSVAQNGAGMRWWIIGQWRFWRHRTRPEETTLHM
ncbi:hypothetical protein [Azospirillum melinis]